MITIFIVSYIVLSIWIVILLIDTKSYREYIEKREEIEKRMREAKEGKVTKLNWPEHIPHPKEK